MGRHAGGRSDGVNAEAFLRLVKVREAAVLEQTPDFTEASLASGLIQLGFTDAVEEAMTEPGLIGHSQKWLAGSPSDLSLAACCNILDFDPEFISRISLEIIDAIGRYVTENPEKIKTIRPEWMPWNYFHDDFEIPSVYYKRNHEKPWYYGMPEYNPGDVQPFNAEQQAFFDLINAPCVRVSEDDMQMFRTYRKRSASAAVEQLTFFA